MTALDEIEQICIERNDRLAAEQKPGWQDECVSNSLPAMGLLDETSMPHINGTRRDTKLERLERTITEEKAKV